MTERQKYQTDALRRHAEAASVGNVEIAEALGISRSAVSRTMRGLNAKPRTVRRIREYLKQIDPTPDLHTPEAPGLQTRQAGGRRPETGGRKPTASDLQPPACEQIREGTDRKFDSA